MAEAYNLHRSTGKVIKELNINLGGALSPYLVLSGNAIVQDLGWTTIQPYNAPFTGRVIQMTTQGNNTGNVYGYLSLGPYFNDVKSCEIEISLSAYTMYNATSGTGKAYAYLWGSGILCYVDKEVSSDKYTEIRNGYYASPTKQNIVLSSYNYKSGGSLATGAQTGFIINSLKFKNVKF